MKKEFYLFLILLFSISIATLTWPLINIPAENLNYGGEYFEKNYNKNNDTLRFISFILISLIPFLFLYLNMFKDKTISIKEITYINLKNKKVPYDKDFFILFLILILGSIFEFFIIDFKLFISNLDLFHEGIWLTAASNYMLTEKFWVSSYIDRGFFGTFFPLILWEILDNQTIGAVRLSNLILLLMCKISLIFLAKNISKNIDFSKTKRLIFFLLLSLTFLTLVNYFNPGQFVKRSLLILIFLNLLINILQKNNITIYSFVIGFLSALSFLWWLDIAAYINLILFLLLVFFIIRRETNIFFMISLGVVLSWLTLFFYLPNDELAAFKLNTLNILSTVDQIQGLIYPIPFFSGDTRATKTLLFFIIGGVASILICFNKKNYFNNSNKIFFIFLFILSLISFKTGLSRSDSAHIKTAIGPLMLVILSYFVYLIIEKLNSKFIDNLNNKLYIKLGAIIFIIFYFSNFNLTKIMNIKDSLKNIETLIVSKDADYLKYSSLEYIEFVKYYKEISLNENCVQIFTDDVAIPFLLKKKTCTKFYQTWVGQPQNIQAELLSELKKNLPNIILFKSDLHDDYNLNMLNNYFKDNYIAHSKFKHWTFIKKKN